ncbi:MAG: HAD-IB family phosphatase [Clostridia bacterium]|nr:HAD-IB family phosphatase [Clostridia bacterium]
MNVYDFDKTIYSGDSTANFYKHCLKKYKSILKTVPGMLFAFLLYNLNIYTLTQFKEKMYKFLTCVPDIDKEVELFWNKNMQKIKPYYLSQKRDDDVIISASPEFLLIPICEKLGVGKLMASRVDKHTGKYEGENCRDTEKVRRFYEWDSHAKIDTFYSDSLSDTPLANEAEKAFIVSKNDELIPWQDYKKPKYKMFLSREFMMFLVIGVINTFAGALFATLYRHFIPDNTVAFVPGWISGNIVSYFLNSVFTFRDTDFGIVKYIKFLVSNLPNLLIQTVMVKIFSDILNMPSMVVYAIAAIIGVPVTFVLVKLFAFAKKD